MRLKNICALFLVFLFLAGSTNLAAAQTADRNLKKRLDAVIDEAIGSEKIVGATLLVAEDGKIVYRRAAGYNDREARRKLKESDVFRLASMTKLIVSVAALALVDEGKLALDDPVTKYLPFFRPKLADGRVPVITVRHLLTHTAGLNYGFFEKSDGPYHRLRISDGLDNPDLTLEENVELIAAAPLLFEPGTNWNYSLSTDVLGLVLKKAAGRPLSNIVSQKVTAPLGMKDTAFYAEKPERLVVPYADAEPRPVRMSEPFLLNSKVGNILFSPARVTDRQAFDSGGAGMVGTIQDYLKLLEALRTGGAPVLKPESASLFAENAIGEIDINNGTSGWGFTLGASILKDPAAAKTPQSTGTWAWGGAYGHSYFVDPQKKLTVICLTNTAVAGMVGEFPDAIVKAVYAK